MNQCHACGVPIEKSGRGPAPKHCPPCKHEHRRNLPSQIHQPMIGPRGAVCVCSHCGQDFVAATRVATVCKSIECRRKFNVERGRDRLKANADAGNVCHCGQPVQAKGLCRTHYKKSHRATHGHEVERRVEVSCAGCGEPIMRRPSDLKTRVPTCGYACRQYVTFGTGARTDLPADHWARWWGRSSKWTAPKAQPDYDRECPECGASFTTTKSLQVYCDRKCHNKASKSRRRAVKAGAFVEDVNRNAIFERDKWTCKLCDKKLKRNAAVPHPLAPTIDHIIPMGDKRYRGTHEPANVQAAHFYCNSSKGNRGGGEQLALVG